MLDARRGWIVALLGGALTTIAMACGSADELFSSGGSSGATGPTGGSGGSGGASTGTGTATPSGTGGSGGGMQDAGPDAPICESQELDGIEVVLDLFLVVDRSGSMSGTLWTGTVNALNAFFTDPASTGINVGLNLFPPVTGTGECVMGDYNPLQYPASIPPLFLLPDDSAELATILNGAGTAGVTPMYAALAGTYQVAVDWQTAHANHEVVVVLASDGSPNSCSSVHGTDEIQACAGLAGAAYGGEGIETYCIVLDSAAMGALTAVAQAGGTTTPYNIAGNVGQFAQVMADIRDQAMGCEILVPEPTGDEFDKTHVYVHYLPGGTGSPQLIPQLSDAGSCGSGPGWYFDYPGDPERIILCPASCSTIDADPDAKITVEFACPS
ncbi:MAG: VWA domain-containing protein [Deltaproteobacteria bacterium]|jgi:hypothetical protein|nr:VWA domain-containing protein [Deltaproteobacteria bacterium]MBW2530093.1 VWA domain-containing protein [Deltaproteobacteria bacterium]